MDSSLQMDSLFYSVTLERKQQSASYYEDNPHWQQILTTMGKASSGIYTSLDNRKPKKAKVWT